MAFVDELDVLVDCEDVELDKFISAVAAKEIELLYNKLIIKIPIIKNIFDNFDICKNILKINEEKRNKFMEYAGKRVNNVLHDMQILEPMARSNSYDFTKEDVEEMFGAMQSTLNDVRAEFNKKFEEKARNEKKVFSFGNTKVVAEKVEDEVIDLDNNETTSSEDVEIF